MGRMIWLPLNRLQNAVENHPRPLDFENLCLWSGERIHQELMARCFVHRELGSTKVYGLEYENARRLLMTMQSEYFAVLEEDNARLRAWQTQVAHRDRRIAELETDCAVRDERIAELERLLLALTPTALG